MSNNPKNILFRADSSSTIGTGHIMRDLVLAEQYSDASITFATQDLEGNINHKIIEAGYVLEILSSHDKEELVELIQKLHIDMVVFDSYDVDYAFEKFIKEKTGVQILSLDDNYEKHYCDILLNHNIYADKQRYKDLVPSHCEVRCGSKYTLLRQEFKEAKQHKKLQSASPNLNIFIAMGGTDHLNISTKVLKAIKEIQKLRIDVVTTTSNPNLNELKKFVESKNNITLHTNINYISRLINQSDLAIITPSVIMNEIFYMEIPFIAIKTACNQQEMHNYLIKNNYISLDSYDEKKFMYYFNKILPKENKCLKNI